MRCLCPQLQSSVPPLPAKLKLRHTTILFQTSTHRPPRGKNLPSASSLSTNALPHLMVVAPAQSGDLSTLLPISVVLVLAYFIANFVVPGFLINSSGYDESKEEEKDADVNAER
ncbi:hypothetical protein Fmac_030612 [Flemingia macrophylla]|uniref:Transmembrane protein n=1 Tax=Flemingia macrophylla TaxID=520843 RepID=A0ABD1KZQ9_9FABA